MFNWTDFIRETMNFADASTKNYNNGQCCTDNVQNRTKSKDYSYIVTFLLDEKEKTLSQKGPSKEQVLLYFRNLMREFCPNEFRGWNSLEIISIKRRETQ